MAIGIDSALGVYPEALRLRERRTEILAANLANADTPGFKAQDFDFKATLAQQNVRVRLASTNAGHIETPGTPEAERLYRVPSQAALDGNTVDPHLEKAAFAENAIRYQTTLMLLGSRIGGLMSAIRGE